MPKPLFLGAFVMENLFSEAVKLTNQDAENLDYVVAV